MYTERKHQTVSMASWWACSGTFTVVRGGQQCTLYHIETIQKFAIYCENRPFWDVRGAKDLIQTLCPPMHGIHYGARYPSSKRPPIVATRPPNTCAHRAGWVILHSRWEGKYM